MITSLTRADGLLRIGAESDGIEEGSHHPAELLRDDPAAVDQTLVVVGSHDVTIDHLADHLRQRAPQLHLSAANVGSLAGLLAVRAGRCHVAGTHLLDPRTGEYNVSYVQRHLRGLAVRLVTLAHREQGLIVAPGNPKRIEALTDLARSDVRLINRQAGSGTRVLLDHHLARAGIDPEAVGGYGDEEYTHMAVAVQVLSGAADVGLGILAAARALGLDFVPVASERYDLCIPERLIDDPRVRAMLDTLASADFRRAVESLGGYDVSPMGTVAWRSA